MPRQTGGPCPPRRANCRIYLRRATRSLIGLRPISLLNAKGILLADNGLTRKAHVMKIKSHKMRISKLGTNNMPWIRRLLGSDLLFPSDNVQPYTDKPLRKLALRRMRGVVGSQCPGRCTCGSPLACGRRGHWTERVPLLRAALSISGASWFRAHCPPQHTFSEDPSSAPLPLFSPGPGSMEPLGPLRCFLEIRKLVRSEMGDGEARVLV